MVLEFAIDGRPSIKPTPPPVASVVARPSVKSDLSDTEYKAMAIHEAGHAVVAHALGIRFDKRVAIRVGKKNFVQTHRIEDERCRSTTLIAFSLAGGMAEYRAVGTAGVGHGYGSNLGDDDDGDDVFRILGTLAEKEGFCGYDRETPLAIDLRAAVKAICEGRPYSGRPELVEMMAESAMIARRILN